MNSNVSANLSAEDTVKEFFGGGAGAATTSDSDALSVSLANLWQTIHENRWGIILFMIAGCLAGVFKAVSETPVYQARLTMAVEPSSSRGGQSNVFDPFAYRFYETQYELLKSRSVAERVVDQLQLVERESVQSLLLSPSIFRSLTREFTRLTGISLVDEPKVPQTKIDLTAKEKEQKRRWLTGIIQSGVSVSGGEKTNLVQVSFRSINPDFAAEIANELVSAYIDLGLDSQLSRSQQTTQWLSQRIDGLKVSLDQAQSNLQRFLVEENLLDSSRSAQITTSELQTLNAEYNGARAKLDELAKRYGARHPKITEARAEMLAAKQRLDSKSRSISSSREKQVELARLERDVQVNQELYEAFLAKFKEADISASGSQVASARIVDRALPPSGPIYPQKNRIIVMWTLGGLMFGIMLAFLRQQLDSTFKTGRMLEEKLGLPLFGILQSLGKDTKAVERHYLDNKRSVFSESINHIRTGITYSNVDNPPHVMVVTSSVQSEGKTTLASNLALSYAQQGKTLLIDADLRRPRIKHIIETDTPYGLVDYVAGMVELSDCIRQDKDEKNLFILNSGTTPPNPLELLASDRFRQILQDLRGRFEHIIIDTAPVLPASDAVVLGRLSDALLMVVQSDKTTFHMARDAVKRLNASRVPVAGLILTQANIKKAHSSYYGGYYGYGAYAYVEDSAAKES
ncbi:GumC family protein [Arenicella xantha]|uniref:GumC family protein n=1 Tax=Arenicella xantha TaxID=644221 RepID=UPI001474ECA6|nr:polysaccharide biosynthesis tyrosine autokinase [Arenicella xantha]